jgi:hypothetical protein
MRKDSPLQDSCWWDVGCEKTILSFKALGIGASSQEEATTLFMERIFFLSFMMQIKGLHDLLKENPSNFSVLTVRVEVNMSSHFPLPVCRGP